MKALRTWTIVTLVFIHFSFLLLQFVYINLLDLVIGWLLPYEEITSEVGHTAEGAYKILTNVSIILFSILFITNQILHFCYRIYEKSKAKLKL